MPRSCRKNTRALRRKYGGGSCFNIQNSAYDTLPFPSSIRKQHACFRVDDGTPCCMAMCGNGYRCQKKSMFVAKIELQTAEQVTCSQLLDIPKTELVRIRNDEVMLCEDHMRMWLKRPQEKQSYVSTIVKAGVVAACVGAVALAAGNAIVPLASYGLGAIPWSEVTKKLATMDSVGKVTSGITQEVVKGATKDYFAVPASKFIEQTVRPRKK